MVKFRIWRRAAESRRKGKQRHPARPSCPAAGAPCARGSSIGTGSASLISALVRPGRTGARAPRLSFIRHRAFIDLAPRFVD